ncbi:MAG: hypothetical protein CVT88_05480 [Candidatus Altiarchaeales archaeon HGW-Altiarchaeales-1]|nr:MAG: hypothetical protein CVT88_05480 [Candidatus Altiarchaeales archaeon HGW-Altiarchaeales-1]
MDTSTSFLETEKMVLEILKISEKYKETPAQFIDVVEKLQVSRKEKEELFLFLGIMFENQSNLRLALVCLEHGLTYLEEGDTKKLSACYMYLGLINHDLKNYNKAAEYYEKAEKIFAEIGQTDALKILYKNMRETYKKMKSPEKAEEYKRKAEEILT